MINKKRLGALLAAGTMIVGMNITAFAQDPKAIPNVGTGTENAPAVVSVTKDFEMAEGLSIPSVTFNFAAAKVTPDAPDAAIQPIQYSSADAKGNADNGKYILSKESAITFGAFPHAGEYVYTVTENKENAEGVTYSADKYTLRAQVANKQDGGLYVKNITAEKGTNNGTGENKVDQILFTNTYRKNASLIIEKKTTGELADKTKKFDFTITFEKSATEGTLTDFTGTITRKGNTTEQLSCTNGKAEFRLADGDRLTFTDLPAGTKYKVTEKGVTDGYVAYVKVTDNGTQGMVINGTDDKDLVTSANGNYIGEKENKVEFENRYNEVPITGIIMNNLPFILMIGAAVVAFGTLSVIKRRRTSDK